MDRINDLPVGARVITKKTCNGIEHNGMTYGYLPEGAKGTVTDHTVDGRAVILFHGYGVHTGDEEALQAFVAVTPESALLARFFAEIVEERRVPLLSTTVQLDRALLHLLRSCEDKFVYEGDKEAFHKQFRQQDVTGNADIDMAIWWLLGGSERFWSAFDEVREE